MSDEQSPYVNRCNRCGNGLLRLYRCEHCQGIAAICDECELLWQDIPKVSSNAECPSDGTFPVCPQCDATRSTWIRLDSEAIHKEQLDDYLAGQSG